MYRRERNNNKFTLLFFFALIFIFILEFPLFSQERFRRIPPSPDPLPKLNLPEIESAILSNGLSLSVVRQENLPIIYLRLIILSGESSSPEDLPGLASFTANMLSQGTRDLSSSDIEEAIESVGGEFSSAVYPDYSIFSFAFLEDFLDDALNLLAEMILQPSFSKKEIDNVLRSMYYDLLGKNSDPEFIAKRLLFQILFKEHAYQNFSFNEDGLRKFEQKDIISFFDRYYRPENTKLILVGNLNLSTASRKVSSHLKTWRKSELQQFRLPPPKPIDKLKICFVNIPEAKEVTIYLGNAVSSISDQEFFPLLVFNQVLGGTPFSRLFMNLRESKGYAYFAFSNLESFKNAGVFYLNIKVKPEDTYFSIMESLNEIQRITKEKIPNFEIEQAKSYLIGNFPLKIETFDSLSLKVSEIQAFNLGEEHWEKYHETLMLINSENVFEATQKYPLNPPVVVIAGNINIISKYLQEFEEIEVYNPKGILQYIITKEEEE